MGDITFNTDFGAINPEVVGGARFLPVSDSKGHIVVIKDSDERVNRDEQGKHVWFLMEIADGPNRGALGDITANHVNKNPDAVRFGMGFISAIGHAIGHTKVGKASEWYNKPFRVVVAPEAPPKEGSGRTPNPNATRVVQILDLQGNDVTKKGQAPVSAGNNAGNNSFGGGNPNNGGNNGGFGVNGNNSQPAGNNAGFGGNNNGGGSFGGGGFDPNTGAPNGQNNGINSGFNGNGNNAGNNNNGGGFGGGQAFGGFGGNG